MRGADIPSLPCPACRILLPVPEWSFPFQCIPRSCSNIATLYFLWCFQHHHRYPPFPTVFPQSVVQLSQPSHPASPLQSHVRRILQCKVPIKHQQANMAEALFSHGCSGNGCTTCRDRLSVYELRERAWLSEPPALA